MHKQPLVVIAITMLAGLTACVTAPSAPGAAGRIAFASDRDGGHEIYVMNADGSGVTRLTSTQLHGKEPSWEPVIKEQSASRRIAFTLTRHPGETDSSTDVFIINSDGSGLKNLTSNPDSWSPAWQPLLTGSSSEPLIAFVTVHGNESTLYVEGADGSGLTPLTTGVSAEFPLRWSPDGKRIAFTSNRGGVNDVYVINSDGTGLTNLSRDPGFAELPEWSPDGTRIAFVSDRDGNHEIYVMNADGSGLTRLTNSPQSESDPVWSPDGIHIAYVSRGARHEIFVMNADGSGAKNLSNNPAADSYSPLWSPDGQFIVFVSNRAGSNDIFIMKADGSLQTNLTNNKAGDDSPAWEP